MIVGRSDSLGVPGWLLRDYTARSLAPLESLWVTKLRASLQELRPDQIDPDETAVTAEGEGCLICLLPHRSLGGLSIVVTLVEQKLWFRRAPTKLFVSWAQIGDLTYHDDLDLAVGTTVVALAEPLESSLEEALAAVREELGRPVVVRVWGGAGECFLRLDGRLQRVASLGSCVQRALGRLRGRPADFEIRFTDAVAPPITQPSNALAWFPYAASNATLAAGADAHPSGSRGSAAS